MEGISPWSGTAEGHWTGGSTARGTSTLIACGKAIGAETSKRFEKLYLKCNIPQTIELISNCGSILVINEKIQKKTDEKNCLEVWANYLLDIGKILVRNSLFNWKIGILKKNTWILLVFRERHRCCEQESRFWWFTTIGLVMP